MHPVFPVVIFCYNRPVHLKQTLTALLQNDGSCETIVFVFSDGPKTLEDHDKVRAVREVLSNVKGFKKFTVFEQEINKGLAASVIDGVSRVLREYPACIVLEDDLLTSTYFLRYMNEALLYYKEDARIFTVSGYSPPLSLPPDYTLPSFLFPRINAWGWGTWRDRWELVDWRVVDFFDFIGSKTQRRLLSQQGEDLPVMLLKQQEGCLSSWAVRFNQSCFKSGRTNVYPRASLVANIGADGSGRHMKASRKFQSPMSSYYLSPYPAESNNEIALQFRQFYRPSWHRRLRNRLKIEWYLCRREGFKILGIK
ncbi:glycosyltransferase [Geofilum rhodophaeum]|uniref:glycosyltransferase n=1 Tax=Geofilum rhodophaeum TaxID=1965019 RepID=UPI000B527A18|nr:glycosyltransferase [Geofilum rhodophaeum]